MRKGMILTFLILFVSTKHAVHCQSSQANLSNQKLAYDIFKELIDINTTYQYGSKDAALALASRLKAAGFSENDMKVIGPDSKHKNLVVRYRGKGKQRPVLFICHLDVVEALPGDWSVDPFTFLEKDGYLYGRGTTDIKCEDANLIANLIRFKMEKYLPDRDIIVALTDGEEGGEINGVDWLLRNHRELIDAEFCINPDGAGGDLKNGKHFAMSVQTSEKIYITIELETKNNGGHSSLPVKDNAIYELSGALMKISDFDFPVNLNETTRKLFENRAMIESGQIKGDMLAVAGTPMDTAAAGRIAGASSYYNAMMRTTCVATMMDAGHAENALPQRAHAIVNCRMLPDEKPEDILNTIVKVVQDTSVKITNTYTSFVAPISPLREDVMTAVEKITESMWPGVNVSPIMSTGATDGKYLRMAGIPVYGVSGMFGDPEDVRAHGRDERISVRCFYDGVEFMYRFIKEITAVQ